MDERDRARSRDRMRHGTSLESMFASSSLDAYASSLPVQPSASTSTLYTSDTSYDYSSSTPPDVYGSPDTYQRPLAYQRSTPTFPSYGSPPSSAPSPSDTYGSSFYPTSYGANLAPVLPPPLSYSGTPSLSSYSLSHSSPEFGPDSASPAPIPSHLGDYSSFASLATRDQDWSTRQLASAFPPSRPPSFSSLSSFAETDAPTGGDSSLSRTPSTHMCSWPDCGRTFNRPSNRDAHERTHTGERPFVCEHCGIPFTVNSNLRRHLRNLHGMLLVDPSGEWR